MKFILLILLTICTQSTFAQQMHLTSLNGNYYNSMFDTVTRFNINLTGYQEEKKNYLVMSFQPTLGTYTVFFTAEERKILLESIQKYKEWRQIAIDNKVTNTKEIATLPVNRIHDSIINEVVGDGKLTVTFASADTSTHYLTFNFHEMASSNMFLNITPDPFFLDINEVNKLVAVIENPDFDKDIEIAINQKKSTDDLFQ